MSKTKRPPPAHPSYNGLSDAEIQHIEALLDTAKSLIVKYGLTASPHRLAKCIHRVGLNNVRNMLAEAAHLPSSKVVHHFYCAYNRCRKRLKTQDENTLRPSCG